MLKISAPETWGNLTEECKGPCLFLASMISAQCKKALRPSPVIICELLVGVEPIFKSPYTSFLRSSDSLKLEQCKLLLSSCQYHGLS